MATAAVAEAITPIMAVTPSYGYGWYVVLIWVPLYNVLSARAVRSRV